MIQSNRIEYFRMNKFALIICLFLVGCNSKETNDAPEINTLRKVVEPTSLPEKNFEVVEKPAIILDTLVFTENFRGAISSESLKTSQRQLLYYKNFINPKRINKMKIITEKHTKTEVRYLGKIKDLDEKNYYHVITIFRIWGIGQMLSPRGRSEVAFINKNKIVVYDMQMQYNLPKYIKKNVLYFEYEKTKIGISIFGGFAPALCVPEIECFELI